MATYLRSRRIGMAISAKSKPSPVQRTHSARVLLSSIIQGRRLQTIQNPLPLVLQRLEPHQLEPHRQEAQAAAPTLKNGFPNSMEVEAPWHSLPLAWGVLPHLPRSQSLTGSRQIISYLEFLARSSRQSLAIRM